MLGAYVQNDREEHFSPVPNEREEISTNFSDSPELLFSSLPKQRHFSLISQSSILSLAPVKNMSIPSMSNLMSEISQGEAGGLATGESTEKGGGELSLSSERFLLSVFFRDISVSHHPGSGMCLR